MASSSVLWDKNVLELLTWSEIEELYRTVEPPKRKFKSETGLLDIERLDEEVFRQQFRFRKDDFPGLLSALRVPATIRSAQGVVLSGEEALCIGLRRLCYPNRLCDMERFFGRHTSTLSSVVNTVVDYIDTTFGYLLDDLTVHEWLSVRSLEIFSQAVHAKGAPLENCWGFVDGTARPICRPTVDQKRYFSGHKRHHVVKYQSLMAANGIIAQLDGPYPGHRHDAGILRDSSLYGNLEKLVQGRSFVIYGDPAYPLRPLLMKPYSEAESRRCLQKNSFNKQMSSVRQAVEWGFGKIVTLFAFVDFKKNQKLLLQNVPRMYRVATILTNCHTCLYGSEVSDYFGVLPPTLTEYLQCPE